MDDYTDTNITQEIKDAEEEADIQFEVEIDSMPKMESLLTHTASCERTTPQFVKHARKHRRCR